MAYIECVHFPAHFTMDSVTVCYVLTFGISVMRSLAQP